MNDEEKVMMLLAEANDLLRQLNPPPDSAEAGPDTAELYPQVTRVRREIHDLLYAYRQRKGSH